MLEIFNLLYHVYKTIYQSLIHLIYLKIKRKKCLLHFFFNPEGLTQNFQKLEKLRLEKCDV